MADNNFSASDFVEVEAYERNGKTVQGYVRRIGGGPATPEETEKFYAEKYGATQAISKDTKSRNIKKLLEKSKIPEDQTFSKVEFLDFKSLLHNNYLLQKERDGQYDMNSDEVRNINLARERYENVFKDRLAATLEYNSIHNENKTLDELIKSGKINENSPKAELSEEDKLSINLYSSLPKDVQSKAYQLPTNFIKVLKNSPKGQSNYRNIIKIATDLKKMDLDYSPAPAEEATPRAQAKWLSDESKTFYPQMQKVGPYCYDLLIKYANKKYGGQSKEFWKTVRSETVNYPKISDFVRAVKRWDSK